MNSSRHLGRALWIIGALFVIGNIGRLAMVPESFGQYGQFRGGHLLEERERDPVIRGTAVCGECHEDRFTERNEGAHKSLNCEGCHFQPYAGDENHPEAHPAVSISPNRSPKTCLVCHQYTPARPASVPQLTNFHEHIAANSVKINKKELGAEPSKTLCVQCHNPHAPKINLAPNGQQ